MLTNNEKLCCLSCPLRCKEYICKHCGWSVATKIQKRQSPRAIQKYFQAFTRRAKVDRLKDWEYKTDLLRPTTAPHHWSPHPSPHPTTHLLFLNSLQVSMHPTIYLSLKSSFIQKIKEITCHAKLLSYRSQNISLILFHVPQVEANW